MMENLIKAFLETQAMSIRRKAKGVALEVAAFCMVGLSLLLLFVGLFLWPSSWMEPWVSAIVLAIVALCIGLSLMLFARSFRKTKGPDAHDQAMLALKALGMISKDGQPASSEAEAKPETGPVMVASALAAGLILGHSMHR